MSGLKTPADKAVALKQRRDQERKLGATVDHLLRQADAEPSGCGVCMLWRRLTGRQRNLVSRSDQATAGEAAQTALFGMKKSNPHAKLTEAAAAIGARIASLEARAASERMDARRLVRDGHKTQALRVLKKAKQTEKQAESNQQSLLAVEQQIDAMSQAEMQATVAKALASSTQGFKQQTKLLKSAEAAVDGAQEARDTAEDLGSVMSEFAQSVGGEMDDDELMDELQAMLDEGPIPPNNETREEEAARLEARIAAYDEAKAIAAAMPSVPKANMARAAPEERAGLLGEAQPA